jgi:hypothetical protein
MTHWHYLLLVWSLAVTVFIGMLLLRQPGWRIKFPRLGFARLDAYEQVLVDVRERMR